MDRDANEPGSRSTWKDWITDWDDNAPDEDEIRKRVNQIMAVIRQIPAAIISLIKNKYVHDMS